MPTLDLFASWHNRQSPQYLSLRLEPETLGVNALVQRWSANERLYAFPPVAMLMQVVQRVRRDGLQMIIVLPAFGGTWYPWLLELATQAPVLLPEREIFRGLDGTFRQSTRFRSLVWTVNGHRPLRLPVSMLREHTVG